MAIGCVLLCGVLAGGAHLLLEGANDEPETAFMLRGLATRQLPPVATPRRAAVVLIDGLRVDEARRLPSLRALARSGRDMTLALRTPTLSRPFYHMLLTGVPPDGSGVRSNRFRGRARFDSVADRVREAGGSVMIGADGLDWIREMYGREGDRGSDARGSLEGRALEDLLGTWRAAPLPSLLITHAIDVDHSAHDCGISCGVHRDALRDADRLIARIARENEAIFVLSDHGHRSAGGHGGPEPEVARAPLVIRAPGLRAGRIDRAVDPTRIAATLSAWLGVPAPRSSVGRPIDGAVPPGFVIESRERLRPVVEQGTQISRGGLRSRRVNSMTFALLFAMMTLGPIKRAFSFDRSIPIAIVLWPLAIFGAHLALDRPLSLSAIDLESRHIARVATLGVAAAVAIFALTCVASREGTRLRRTRRSIAITAWSAFAWALFACAWVGFELGPWPLSPIETYAPLLLAGAAIPVTALAALALLVSARGRE
jgi:2,3-bisphosphoglycerate-independent phosphoglycerate mutase